MKVVLVIPPSPFLIDDRAFPFLGPLQIAAVARNYGHDVHVADLTGYKARHPDVAHPDPEGVHQEAEAALLRLLPADLVGFYSLAAQHPTVVRLHEAVRTACPEAWTALGGPHASTAPERAAKDGFDFIVVADQGGGGGEPGFLELLKKVDYLSNNTLMGAGKNPAVILREKSREPDGGKYQNDRWPLPARDLIDLASYRYSILGERATSVVSCTGCPYACTYSLTGDALIHTDRGFERLDSLMVGESVVEACGHGSFVRTHRVGRSVATAEGSAVAAEAVSEGIRPVFEVMTENGLKVKATAEHPFLTVDGSSPVWKKVS